MDQSFQKFIHEHRLCKQSDHILLAVSGGIDSMTMVHLFLRNGFKDISIAHCNFKLRGEDSDHDQQFIEQFCADRNILLHFQQFDTSKYAEENKVSVQMAARELRYNWFQKLLEQYNYRYVAIAHNQDDVIETFFINLSRGTGIKGLTGIKVKDDDQQIIRPLLFASRKAISEFSDREQIIYREDKSNSSVKYTRNYIRHKVLPQLNTKFQNFNHAVLETIQNLKETELVYQSFIQELISNHSKKENDQIFLELRSLVMKPYVKTVLHEFLYPYGFHRLQIVKILEAFHNQPGKQFLSDTHVLITDRDHIVLKPLMRESQNEIIYESFDMDSFTEPLPIRITRLARNDIKSLKASKTEVYLDLEKLKLPVVFRRWKEGDYFYPFGMHGKKKISDYFTDIKLSVFEKNSIWLMCSGESQDIVWITGYRSDDRFKVTSQTQQVIKLHIQTDL